MSTYRKALAPELSRRRQHLRELLWGLLRLNETLVINKLLLGDNAAGLISILPARLSDLVLGVGLSQRGWLGQRALVHQIVGDIESLPFLELPPAFLCAMGCLH